MIVSYHVVESDTAKRLLEKCVEVCLCQIRLSMAWVTLHCCSLTVHELTVYNWLI